MLLILLPWLLLFCWVLPMMIMLLRKKMIVIMMLIMTLFKHML